MTVETTDKGKNFLSGCLNSVNPLNFFKIPEALQEQPYKPLTEYKTYFKNPFDVESTKKAWNSTESNLIPRVLYVAMSFFANLLFFNPCKLTVGNIRTYFENKNIKKLNDEVVKFNEEIKKKNEEIRKIRESYSFKIKHYSTGIVKLAAFTLAVAGITYMIGSAILFSGQHLENIPILGGLVKKVAPLIVRSGEIVQSLGKTLCLCVSIPTYAMVYEIPKYLIKNIPEIICNIGSWALQMACTATRLLNNYIITPVFNLAAKFFDRIADLIFYPLFNMTRNVLIWMGREIIFPIINNALIPLVNLTKDAFLWVKDSVVVPALNFVSNALFWVGREIISPIINKTVEVITWIAKNALIPLVNLTKDPFLWVKDSVVVPALNFVSNALFWVGREIISPIINKTVELITWVAEKALVPLVNLVNNTFLWIKDSIIVPVIETSAKKATDAIHLTREALNKIFRLAETAVLAR